MFEASFHLSLNICVWGFPLGVCESLCRCYLLKRLNVRFSPCRQLLLWCLILLTPSNSVWQIILVSGSGCRRGNMYEGWEITFFFAYRPNWSKPCARGYCCWSQVPATQPTMRSFLRMWLWILLFLNVVVLNLISLWTTANTSGFQVMGKLQPVSLPKLTMEM